MIFDRTDAAAMRRAKFFTLLLSGSAAVMPLAAHAQQAGAAATDAEITVTGRRVSEASETIGEDKVTNTVGVTREALLSAPSGVSGLKMLEQLPGFNVQTDGSLGLYEFGNSVQTRAFNLNQIGFVLDGIPMGRSDAFGGSPIFRYVDNENLGRVEASVGAGDVGLPSYSSLGPVVQYNSIAPQDTPGLFVSQSFGDFDMKRTFIRASTGQVGPFKAYVSRTKLDSDLWRGDGSVDREHWEGQIHADLGGSSWARFKFVSNNFHDYDSPEMTKDEYYSSTPDIGGNTGRWRGYYWAPASGSSPFWAPTVTGVPYSNSNYADYTSNMAINNRKDKLYGATFHVGIADNFWAESTLYYEDKSGYGVSADSYSNSLSRYQPELAAGLDVNAPKGLQYGISGVAGHRYGITNKIHWDAGFNSFEAGIWAEVDKYHRTQFRVNTTDGAPSSAPVKDEVVYYRRNYRSERDTVQLFAKDRMSFLEDKLSLELGVKALHVDYSLSGYRNYADYYRVVDGVAVAGYGPQSGNTTYKDFFLPQAGLLYKFDNRTQAFASYSENMAFPKGMDDIFSTTLSSSSAMAPAPAAERSQNYEIGIRTRQPQFYAALAGYYTKFKNRIQSISVLLDGRANATESVYVNVGRVESYGLEFTGNYKPALLHGLAYFNLNATYNHSKFKDDLNTTDGVYALSGKYLPDSAKWVVNGGVTVEPASWLVANFSGKYTSKRWSTMDNSAGSSVPGFTVFNAYVDIGDGFNFGPLKTVKFRFNLDNVFDKKALSYISTQTTGDGYFRPLSPRTFQFTVSAGL